MVSKTQADFHMSLIQERHAEVVRAFDQLIDALARNDKELVYARNKEFISVGDALSLVLAAQHRPSWLKNLLHDCRLYDKNHKNGAATWKAHLEGLVSAAQPLRTEKWHIQTIEVANLDVEAIIRNVCQENKILDLYNQVIEVLRSILNSGEIDSLRVMNDLQEIISSLQVAKKGSFASQIFTWKFARSFTNNLLKNYLEDSKLGLLIKAWNQSCCDLDISIENSKAQIEHEIVRIAGETFRSANLIAQIETAILPSGSLEFESDE